MTPNIPEDMVEIFQDFLTETTESLNSLDQSFIDLEANPGDTSLLNEIFRSVHSIKGGAGFLGLTELVDVAHASENVLNKLRNGELAVSPDIIDVILESIDVIKAIVAQLKGEDAGPIDATGMATKLDLILQFALESATTAAGAAVAQASASQPAAPPAETAAAPAVPVAPAVTQSTRPVPATPAAVPEPIATESPAASAADTKAVATPKVEMETSIRVDTQRLDTVMNLVGELVLCRNRALKLTSELDHKYDGDPAIRELANTVGQLNLVTTDLQLSVMKTRMQPVGKVFQKFPRMVRDLARKLNREINLEVHGEDTELDKSMLEELSDPMVHLVRNAIDHGIEPSDVRIMKGKPAEGRITLSAEYEGASIVIRICDDGAGIDVKKVKKAVLAKGLMAQEQLDNMPDRDAFNLIFLPGLSTKDKVSDISGRGVGMDVVISNLRKVGGIIEIDSEMGKGSTFTISLPLTIAIIQSLMVKVSGRLFAIPLSSIVETLRLAPSEIHVIDNQKVIRLRDRIVPLQHLAEVFGIPPSVPAEGERLNVIVVALVDKKLALLVDSLSQQEEVVIKSLGDYLGDIRGISGATINGEGRVVLILDVGGLINTVT